MDIERDGYHHGDLRNALVEAAGDLIEQNGPGAFSLREAARLVGVTASAAYRHFQDKSALMLAVGIDGFSKLSKRMLREMDRAVELQTSEHPTVARFKAVGRGYVHFALDKPELFRLMFGNGGVECLIPHSASDDQKNIPDPWEILGRALDDLQCEGLLPNERRDGAELRAWTVVHGFASLALSGQSNSLKGKARAAALESVLDFAVVGICGSIPSSPPVNTRRAKSN